MERRTRTRRPTAAERHAARALGKVEPTEVVEDVTPSGALHAARLAAPEKSAKPKGMQTATWYAGRALGGAVLPKADEVVDDVGEEPRPLPRWARRMVYRPDGGGAV